MNQEPVSLVAAITAAITSTLAILLFVGVDPDAVAAITLAVTGWVGVAAAWARSKVTPTENVALTKDDVTRLEGGTP